MEQKVIPIILNGKDSVERMKEITDRLETGIQQLFDSDRSKPISPRWRNSTITASTTPC